MNACDITFFEGSEYLGVGRLLTPYGRYCRHYFCVGCGRTWAVGMVENPSRHVVRLSQCPDCFRQFNLPAEPTISAEGWLEDTFYPTEVYQRDFLLLSEKLCDSTYYNWTR